MDSKALVNEGQALPLAPSQTWEGEHHLPDCVWHKAPPPNFGGGVGVGAISPITPYLLETHIEP